METTTGRITTAVSWRRACYAVMALNAVLMLTTLTVAGVRFTRPSAQSPPCLPGLGRTRGGASTLAPPSSADVMRLTWETIRQVVEERNNNSQEAERFRTKTPQGQKLFTHVVLESSQSFTRDKNLLWDTSHPQSILQGFQYDPRGYLQIPENGFYFVYAHLQYTHKPGLGFDRDRLKDYIFKNEKRFVNDPNLRERMKKKLLFNEQTPCKVAPSQIPLPSSYQGALMELKRDDMLSMASALPENLPIEAGLNYFGAYLI